MIRHIRHITFVAFTTAAASCISLAGGIGLETVAERALPLMPLIIALPALNTTVGDYATIIAAHADDLPNRRNARRKIRKAISKTIWINIVGITVLSVVLAWRRNYLFTADFTLKFSLFIIVALFGVIFGLYVITTLLDRLLARNKINADDILIPIVTSMGDVLVLALVAIAVLTIF